MNEQAALYKVFQELLDPDDEGTSFRNVLNNLSNDTPQHPRRMESQRLTIHTSLSRQIILSEK
jgi:hypothetical protein